MKAMTVEATIENIPRVTAFVESELEAAECPLQTMMIISVALDELCSNVARYAYEGRTGPLTVQLNIGEERRAAQITLIDEGVPYNPLKHKDPDEGLAADEHAIGGMGLLIVKKTMTDLHYVHEKGRNILTIMKDFEERKD